jgi:hypothetical protein
MDQHSRDVRFVPKADILRCSKERHYSITSSAMESNGCGASRPSALAVGAGSAGFSPLRMRST